jgi:hypothetical protein
MDCTKLVTSSWPNLAYSWKRWVLEGLQSFSAPNGQLPLLAHDTSETSQEYVPVVTSVAGLRIWNVFIVFGFMLASLWMIASCSSLLPQVPSGIYCRDKHGTYHRTSGAF